MRRLWPLFFVVAGCHDFAALSSGFERDQSVTTDDMAGPEDLSGLEGDLLPVDGPPPDIAPSCTDGVLGGDETDLDCGGSCLVCEVGLLCLADKDCATGLCDLGRCALATAPPNWVQLGAAATGTNPPIARQNLVVELGPDNNLYAISGMAPDGSDLNDVEKLDQSSFNWTATSTLANSRWSPASASNGSAIFIVSGAQSGGSGFESTVERMMTAPTWTTPTGLAYSVSGSGGTFGNDGKMYIAGGNDGNGAVKLVRSFTPGDTSYATPKDLTNARDVLGVARGSDGRIYALGGHAAGVTLDSGEAYTIAANTWAATAPLPEPRAATHAVLAPDGRIYLPGGANLGGGQIYKSVVAYTAPTGTVPDHWSHPASLGVPRYRHGVGVGADGRIYVVAGADLVSMLRTVEVYGPAIILSTDHKKAGQSITVSGSNFAKNATVKFSLGGPTAPVIGTGTSDAVGAMATTTITIPAAQPIGATRLYATDTRSRYPISAAFTVDP
jgi:hypothetical protein